MNGASLYCGCAWVKHVIQHYCCDSKRKFLASKVTRDPADALSVWTSFHKLCKGMASLRCGRSCDSPNSSYDWSPFHKCHTCLKLWWKRSNADVFHLNFISFWRGSGVELGNIGRGNILITDMKPLVGFGQIGLRNIPASEFFGKVLVTVAGCFVEILLSVGFGEILAATRFGEISLISDIGGWRKSPAGLRFHQSHTDLQISTSRGTHFSVKNILEFIFFSLLGKIEEDPLQSYFRLSGAPLLCRQTQLVDSTSTEHLGRFYLWVAC